MASAHVVTCALGSGLREQPVANVVDDFFPTYRLAARVAEATIFVAVARDHKGLGVLAAGICALGDLTLAAVMARRPLSLRLRLLLDSADVAAWSVAIGPSPDAATLIAVPLAVEAGTRYGHHAFLVVVAIGATTTAVLLAAGRQPAVAPFLWLSLNVVVGMAIARYLSIGAEQRHGAMATELAAATELAELAGQQSVATGADTVVDLLMRTAPLIGASRPDGPLSPLLEWRLALANAASEKATYLGVALTRWQRRRNAASPDLAGDVEVNCLDADGTQLLSRAQANYLERMLDGLHLCGVVTVRGRRKGPAGSELELEIGGGRITVPADHAAPTHPLDLGTPLVTLGAALSLTHSLPWFEAVPLVATLPLTAAGAVVAWFCRRMVVSRGASAHGPVLASALILGATDSVVSTLAMHNTATDQVMRLPFLLFLVWTGPLVVFYTQDLSRAAWWGTWTAIAAIVGAGFALLPGPISWGQVPSGAVWPLATTLASLGVRELLMRNFIVSGQAAARFDAAVVTEAYWRGRRLVMELTTRAAISLRVYYLAVRQDLEDSIRGEADRRFSEVEKRLAALRAEEGEAN